jgi:large subunit ribosomal protein L9
MRVVLLERINKLGQMGDIVDVRSGYARNFLLPFKKALRATKENISYFEKQKSILEAKNLENKKEAEGIKTKIDGKSFILIRSASDTGALYGSVSSKDINEIVSADGIEISKNQIKLEKPVKELGIYKISIILHSDISSEIFINVARSIDEAKLQEKGKKVNNTDFSENAEEETVIKNMFEDETMAEKISNQKEETDDIENSTDSKKQTLESVSSETSSNKSSEEEENISKDQK